MLFRRWVRIVSLPLVFYVGLVACSQAASQDSSQSMIEQAPLADICRPRIGIALTQSTAEAAIRYNESGGDDFTWPVAEGVVVTETLNPLGDIQSGDLILEAADQPIAEVVDLIEIIHSSEVGRRLPLLIQRSGETLSIEVQVQADPICE